MAYTPSYTRIDKATGETTPVHFEDVLTAIERHYSDAAQAMKRLREEGEIETLFYIYRAGRARQITAE